MLRVCVDMLLVQIARYNLDDQSQGRMRGGDEGVCGAAGEIASVGKNAPFERRSFRFLYRFIIQYYMYTLSS